MRKRLLLMVVAVMAAASVISPQIASAGSPPASALGFGYDPLGRLIEASNPSGNVASYSWDSVGNLLSISPHSSSTVSITQVDPQPATAGAPMRIYGSGFSATAGQDAVTIDGSAAAVSLAAPAELVVSVPGGVSSGARTVTVTAPGGSASAKLTITGAAAPTISSVTWTGAQAIVTGSNFDTNGAADDVQAGRTRMHVTDVSSTRLVALAPTAWGSGRVTVTTANGTATSSDQCPGFIDNSATVDQCMRASVGAPQQVSIGTAGHVADLLFDGKAGERVFVSISNSTMSGGQVAITDPYNGYYIANEAWGYVDTTTLPTSGTYTVLLAPTTAGSATVTISDVPPDATYQVTPTQSGAQANVSTVAGQAASVTFTGTAGQRVFVAASNWAYLGNVNAVMYQPDGTEFDSAIWSWGGGDGYLDPDEATLPQSGTYRIALQPLGPYAGSMTVTVYLVPADASSPITIGGAAVSLNMGTPGQNGSLSFNGSSGQGIRLTATNVLTDTFLGIHNPDGSWLTWNNDISPAGGYWVWNQYGKVNASPGATWYGSPYQSKANTSAVAAMTATTDGQGYWVYEGGSTPTLWRYGDAGNSSANFTLPSAPVVGMANDVAAASGGFWVVASNGQVRTANATFYGSPYQSGVVTNSIVGMAPTNDGKGYWVISSAGTVYNYGDAGSHPAISASQVKGIVASPNGGYWFFTATGQVKNSSGTTWYGSPYADGFGGTFVGMAATPDGKGYWLTDSSGYVYNYGDAAQIQPTSPPNVVSGMVGNPSVLAAKLSQTGTYSVLVDPFGAGTETTTFSLADPPGGKTLAAAPPAGTSLARALPLAPRRAGRVSARGGRASARPAPGRPAPTRSAPRRLPPPARASARRRAAPAPPAPRYFPLPASDHGVLPIRTGHVAGGNVPTPGQRSRGPRISFRTSQSPLWTPGRRNFTGDWSMHAIPSPWTELVPLAAPDQGTELAGQVLQLNGLPLAGVKLSVDGSRAQARTDATGRFVLAHLGAGGHRVLEVDGDKAGSRRHRYASFEIGVDLRRNHETALRATIWVPELDAAHTLRVSSPTRRAITLTTPRIPGLQVRIPAGSKITGENGKPVNQLSVIPVPVDRPPFPLPVGSAFPVYLSVQPAGAYVSRGAEIIYPNYSHLPAGQRVAFWSYDPDRRGWYIYGKGTVSKDDKRIVPDRSTRVWQFTGAMVASSPTPPTLYSSGANEPSSSGADPVDLSSGLFVFQKTDLGLRDTLPISATRVYRPADTNSYSFGKGMSSIYDMRLFSQNNYYSMELILPDGTDIHYACVYACSTTYNGDEIYQAQNTPTEFYGSQITVSLAPGNGSGWWNLRLRNGLTYVFIQNISYGLSAIRDRFGNQVTIERNNAGYPFLVSSPNGRWIAFSYDSNNRVTVATDSTGRAVTYTYDGYGRMSQVTDARGGVSTYGYANTGGPDGPLWSVTDPDGHAVFINRYDGNGRVLAQWIGQESTPYTFSYAVGTNGLVTQSTMTDPNGNQTVTNMNSSGFPISQTVAAGTSLAETTTYQRQAGTNLITAKTDQLGRTTTFAYDAHGNLSSIVQAGTRKTSISYDPVFSQPTVVTDPALGTTRYAYDSVGELTQVTDPLGNKTTIAYANGDGLATSVTDPLGNTTSYRYTSGDLHTITNPDGSVTSEYLDAGGRLIYGTNPDGDTTTYRYDPFNDLTSRTDSLGHATTFTYDAVGNLLTLQDANQNTTTFAYDAENRLQTRHDALGNLWTYGYDNDGNLTSVTDPKGQTATYTPDALNRLSFAGFTPAGSSSYQSTINYTYDLGNRLTQAADSTGGTFTQSWDPFDELTQESGPNGTIAYTYDNDGRRTSATVSGQPQVNYGYDAASRLTSISNGSQSVSLSYDGDSRVQQAALPDGVTENYTYDPASQLTDIVYDSSSGSMLGDLHYAYDPAGNQTSEWGSYARLTIPQPWGPATYNADNALATQGTTSYAYDADGNRTSDGTNTYTWNVRNQLTGISGPTTSSFQYDPFGRREQKTTAGSTTSYLYDGRNVVQELSGGTPQVNYLLGTGLAERYGRTDSSGTQSYLTDVLGSTVGLANSSGSVATTYTYDPFGQSTAAGAASANSYQYAGVQNDGTGLQYDLARYYSPGQAQFLSQDPLGFGGSGASLYQYAGDDPIAQSDPTGLSSGNDAANLAGDVAGSLAGGKDAGSAGNSEPNADAAPPADAGQAAAGGSGPPEGGAPPAAAAGGEEPPGGDEPSGIVYRRTDANGGKPYIGQAKSDARFVARQTEHARANPLADFDYEIIGREEPGTQLDRLEEYWIRKEGGPTNKSNPEGALANARHQMSELRYQAAGGDYGP